MWSFTVPQKPAKDEYLTMIEIDESCAEIGADIEQKEDGRSQMTQSLLEARFDETIAAMFVSISEKLLSFGATHFANVRSIAIVLGPGAFAVLPRVTTKLR